MKTVCLFTALALMIMSVTSRDVYDADSKKCQGTLLQPCYEGCCEGECETNEGLYEICQDECCKRPSKRTLGAVMAKRRDAFVKALMTERDDEEPVPQEKIYTEVTDECLACYPGCIESEAAQNQGVYKELYCEEYCNCPDNYRP